MKYQLCKGEVLTVEAVGDVEALTVTEGQVWLTRSGDTRDYCLAQGEMLQLRKGEKLILEALRECAVAFTCSARQRSAALFSWREVQKQQYGL